VRRFFDAVRRAGKITISAYTFSGTT
jgi:hypothetical protein